MPELGKKYEVDASNGDGILVVAFPNKDAETSFEFDYWTEIKGGPSDGVSEEDDMMMIYIYAGAGAACLLIVTVIVVCILCRRRGDDKVQAFSNVDSDS